MYCSKNCGLWFQRVEEVVDQERQEPSIVEPVLQRTETAATLSSTHRQSPLERKRKIDNVDDEDSMSMFKRVRLLEPRYALGPSIEPFSGRSWKRKILQDPSKFKHECKTCGERFTRSTTLREHRRNHKFHPLVAKYLSRVGDVEILKERLDEHLEKRYILEEEKALSQALGLNLAESIQKWLDNYSNTKTLFMDQLEEADLNVANSRQNCFSRGLVDEEGNPTDLASQDSERPFSCSICSKQFSRLKDRNRHEALHLSLNDK
jgi:hypothetical protein